MFLVFWSINYWYWLKPNHAFCQIKNMLFIFWRLWEMLTLEPLPENQFQQLTAGREVRVGVRHRVSIWLQVQDTHCEGDTNTNSGPFSPDLGYIAITLTHSRGASARKWSEAGCCLWQTTKQQLVGVFFGEHCDHKQLHAKQKSRAASTAFAVNAEYGCLPLRVLRRGSFGAMLRRTAVVVRGVGWLHGAAASLPSLCRRCHLTSA